MPLHMALPAISVFFFLFVYFNCSFSISDYVLYTDEVLMAGQNLSNGPHRLAMQHNCQLVLYTGDAPTWSTNATKKGGNDCYLALTQKGELVIRSGVHYALWSTGARSKKGKYSLVLDGKGRIGVYGHLRWSTSIPKGVGGPDVPAEEDPPAQYVLHSGHQMLAGEKLRYKEYELAFSRCNLVINNTRSGRWLWQTNTTAAAPTPEGCYLQLENSGQLSVKNGGQRIWSSNKRGDSGLYVAVLQFDGRLAVYGPLLWANVRMEDSTVPANDLFGSSGAVRAAGVAGSDVVMGQ